MAITRKIDDRRGEAIMLFNIALVYKKLGNDEKAVSSVEAALEIFIQFDTPYIQKALDVLNDWKAKT